MNKYLKIKEFYYGNRICMVYKIYIIVVISLSADHYFRVVEINNINKYKYT